MDLSERAFEMTNETPKLKNYAQHLVVLATLCNILFPQLIEAAVREYWVAAEKVEWNYAPSGKNLIMAEKGMDVWGKTLVYRKYRYIQYSDSTYNTPVKQAEWMGILGPQLRAVEGDTLKVHFLNRADKPLSIHPHGMHYDEANEGADMKGKGAYVKSGENFTYTWQVDHAAAPGPADPSSIVWVYHSHVDPVTEIYDGLIGTIVITKKGMERSTQDPRPKDIDVAFTTMYMVFDENGREKVHLKTTSEKHHDKQHHELQETLEENHEMEEEGNLKHSINGYIFGNLEGLEVTEGQRVRWHLIGMGTEVDLHTAHWHGKTVLDHGRRTDVVELLPTSMRSVDMIADNPGNWLMHCHVTDHITAGMITRWQVHKK